MLYFVVIVFGIICIIKCMSHGLSQEIQRMSKCCLSSQEKKKKDLTEQELHFIIKIVSIGLVDADPDTLQHIREYRDLRGSAY